MTVESPFCSKFNWLKSISAKLSNFRISSPMLKSSMILTVSASLLIINWSEPAPPARISLPPAANIWSLPFVPVKMLFLTSPTKPCFAAALKFIFNLSKSCSVISVKVSFCPSPKFKILLPSWSSFAPYRAVSVLRLINLFQIHLNLKYHHLC